MGKGGGCADERNFILGHELLTHAESHVSDGAHLHLHRWLDETDVEHLAKSLYASHSPTEQAVIGYRLRQLAGYVNLPDPEITQQPSFDEIRSQLAKHGEECRALFLQDSLLKDDLLYARLSKHKGSKTVSEFFPHAASVALPHWKLYNMLGENEELVEAINFWATRKVRLKGSSLDVHDIINAFKRRRSKLDTELQDLCDDATLKTIAAMVYAQWTQPGGGMIKNAQIPDNSGTQRFDFFADVTTTDEENLIRHLVGRGAKVDDNPYNVPAYQSWATIHPGKRFTLQLPDGSHLHYVPHYSVGTKEISTFKHTVVVPPPSEEEAAAAKLAVTKGFKKHYQTPDQMLIREFQYTDGRPPNRKLVFPERDKKYGKLQKKMAQTGEEVLRGKGTEHERVQKMFPATDENLTEFSSYMVPMEEGKYMWSGYVKKLSSIIDDIDEDVKRGPVEVSWKDSDAGAPSPANPIAWQSFQNALPANASQRLRDDSIADALVHSKEEEKSYHSVPHHAPMSERGVLKIEGADPDAAIKYLQEHEIASGLQAEVPYGLMYPGKRRLGRVTPKHIDYLAGKHDLQVPKNHAVIHGMTGVSTVPQAIDRLKLVVGKGGLKSISERNRIGVGKVSLSPKGDIASGIDGGVPTKLGDGPSYGAYIYFVMKQDVLERRDLWFSNQDFGGGHNRYDSYNAYAQQIGQGKMHQPPNRKAREKHLKTGLGSTNEAYFKHQISWDEVHSICVDSTGADTVEKLVKGWKKDGILPSHIEVVPYSGVFGGTIVANVASKVQQAYRATHHKQQKPKHKAAATEGKGNSEGRLTFREHLEKLSLHKHQDD